MAITPIDTDTRYGQEDYPGRLVTKNFELLLEIPMKFLMFPMLLSVFPIGIGLIITLMSGSHILEVISWYYFLFMYLAALFLFRNYHIASYYDKQQQRIHEDVYLYRKRLRQRSWPLTDFTGISYGTHGGAGNGYYLAIRLHGHHLGQMLLSFLGAHSREEMIRKANRLAEVTGLPLLPEMTTGPQHQLDDMRNTDRWAYLSRSK